MMGRLARERALFSQLLAWTGARVSEALAVCPASFDLDRNVVSLRTLKRRRRHIREVPIAPKLMKTLNRHFNLRQRQQDVDTAFEPLWRFSRVTAWRFVRGAMLEAGVVGKRANPRGFRHCFGVTALGASVPVTIVQKWLGHARLTTTQIYTAVCGPEEFAFAERFWDA
jgi:integrase/recombinase XerD